MKVILRSITPSIYESLIQKKWWRLHFGGTFYLIFDGHCSYWSESATHCSACKIIEINYF